MKMNPPVLDGLDAVEALGRKYPRTERVLDRFERPMPSRPKAYVASPIFGLEPDERKRAFLAGRSLANRNGYDAVLPIEVKAEPHEGPCPPGRHSEGAPHAEACHIKADIKAMLDCDALILMPDWVISWGCKLEFQVASASGLKIYFADLHWQPGPGAARIGRLIPA